jgi:hypothetical protein
VPLDALGCVAQELFRDIAALLRGAPHDSDAALDCIGDRAGCARSLVSCLRDLISRFPTAVCNMESSGRFVDLSPSAELKPEFRLTKR